MAKEQVQNKINKFKEKSQDRLQKYEDKKFMWNENRKAHKNLNEMLDSNVGKKLTLDYVQVVADKMIKHLENLKKAKNSNDNYIDEQIDEEFEILIEEKDERGNITHYKSPNGYESWKEYDSNNNVIHYKDSDGDEYWQEYDENNNVIKRLELINGKYYLNGKELIREE